MKKFATVFIVMFSLLAAVTLTACTGGGEALPDGDSEYAPYVSYSENKLLMAANEDFNVEVLFYRTETPKALDGKISAPLSNRVKISYIPLKLGGIDKSVSVSYLGQSQPMSKSPVRFELAFDFATDGAPSDSITFTVDGKAEEVLLTDVTAGGMTSAAALTLAADTFKEALSAELKAGFQREISVKIIPDRMGDKPYFFYVSFFQSPEKFSAVLIDPTTGKVVAKKA